jgi:hypothetical protein
MRALAAFAPFKWRGGANKQACVPALTRSHSGTSSWDNDTQVLCTLSSEGAHDPLFALSLCRALFGTRAQPVCMSAESATYRPWVLRAASARALEQNLGHLANRRSLISRPGGEADFDTVKA